VQEGRAPRQAWSWKGCVVWCSARPRWAVRGRWGGVACHASELWGVGGTKPVSIIECLIPCPTRRETEGQGEGRYSFVYRGRQFSCFSSWRSERGEALPGLL